MKNFTCFLIFGLTTFTFAAETANCPHLRGPNYDANAEKQAIALIPGKIPFIWSFALLLLWKSS